MEQRPGSAEEPKCGGSGMVWANVCQDFLGELRSVIQNLLRDTEYVTVRVAADMLSFYVIHSQEK